MTSIQQKTCLGCAIGLMLLSGPLVADESSRHTQAMAEAPTTYDLTPAMREWSDQPVMPRGARGPIRSETMESGTAHSMAEAPSHYDGQHTITFGARDKY